MVGTVAALLAASVLVAEPGPSAGPRHGLELRLALGSSSARDDSLVPLAFTGPTGGVDLGYRRRLPRGRLEVDVRAEIGPLFNRFGHLGAQLHHEVALGYLRDLPGAASTRLALGALARMITDVSFFAYWDDAHSYWLAAVTLGPVVHKRWPLGARMTLHLRGDATLLALASRPPARRLNKQEGVTHIGYYLSRLGESPRFASPLDLQQARMELALQRLDDAGEPGRWMAGAELRLARHARPAPYTALLVGLFVSRRWGA